MFGGIEMKMRLKEITYTLLEGATLKEVTDYIEQNHDGDFCLRFRGNEVSVIYSG